MKKYFTLSKQRGGQVQRLEVMKSLSWSREERRLVRLKRVMSKMFSTGPGSKHFWLWGPHVPCWNTQLCYYSTKAAIDVHKWMTVAVFQWNFAWKTWWWGGFGPWAVVCPAPDYSFKGKSYMLKNWKTVQWPDHVGPKSIVRSCNFNAMLNHWEYPLSKEVTWYNLVLKILFWMLCGKEIIKVISVRIGKLFAVVWARDYDAWPTWGQQRDSVN